MLHRQVFGGEAHVHDRLGVEAKKVRIRVVILRHGDVIHVLYTASDLHIFAFGSDAHGGVVDGREA